MIQRRSHPFLFTAFALSLSGLGLAGCAREAAAPRPKSRRAASGSPKTTHATPQDPSARRSTALLQLVFSLSKAPRDEAKRRRWVGCQLHLLRSTKVPLQVAVDLGDARRRTFYPRTNHYRRQPAIFPYAGNAVGLRLELHTTLPGEAALHRASGRWGRRGEAFHLPVGPPRGFAFSCVLRTGDGGGSAIDGYFVGEKPRLLGSRAVSAEQLKPAAMQAYLRRLL
ncbi:MAG: hypothetical protein CSA65_09055 [Proteobacteria bacterium]|nr:MAG: hypothetical protein CSA65_09055 [Pseudomonadota bacterium]